MAIIDNIKNFFTGEPEQKQNYSTVGFFGVGTGDAKQYKYQDLAKDGYMQNAIVYRCVNEIANGASAVPYMIKQGDDVLEYHPIMDLLDRPNPLQSNSEFFASLYGYLLLSGNSYVLKVGAENQAPSELHLLRPDRITIKGGQNYIPEKYQYIISGRVHAEYEVDQETAQSDLKQIKLWNPLDDYYGLSPLAAGALEIDQHNMAAKHNVNLLNNGARPSGAVVFKPKDDQGFAVNLTESQRQQLLTDLNNRFSGTSNAGRPMLLEGDFDWKEMGLSPKDMDFGNLKHMATTDIALCFGVPSQLVGVPDAQTYANVAEARLALYEETIIPYLKKIESDMNEWLVPMFGEELMFCYDIDSIPALSERRKKIYENVSMAVREGIITRNEARERLGLSPLNGADDLLVNAALFPLGAEETPKPDQSNDEDAKDYEDLLDEEIAQLLEEEQKEDYLFDMHDWEAFAEHKALADIDLKPTAGMAEEAERGLNWRKEFGRGGTRVGVARANQLIRRESLSPDTVKRMFSFFARHEVDARAEGFRQGEKGYPSNGRIAHALWGGDSGKSWSKKKRDQINRELEKSVDIDNLIFDEFDEYKAPQISDKVREALKDKVKEHNDKYGDKPSKRVNLRMLSAVFRRGVGAYNSNPPSRADRPTVSGADQWAYARVNTFLRAVRSGRFSGGKFDTDLLPKGHPLSTKK